MMMMRLMTIRRNKGGFCILRTETGHLPPIITTSLGVVLQSVQKYNIIIGMQTVNSMLEYTICSFLSNIWRYFPLRRAAIGSAKFLIGGVCVELVYPLTCYACVCVCEFASKSSHITCISGTRYLPIEVYCML